MSKYGSRKMEMSLESERWAGIKRGYTSEDVNRIRGTVRVEYSLARSGAERLWDLLHEEEHIAALGIPNEEEYVAFYCERAGRPVPDDYRYYVVLALYRSASIIQGVYKRALDGNASSEEAFKVKPMVAIIADQARKIAEQSG